MTELEEILEDVHEVFSYDREVRPQDRAHAYLGRYRVGRGYNDTAMECCVRDMVERAYAAGGGGADESDDDALDNARRQFAAIAEVANAGMRALDGECD